jgi:hypothetical protein
MADRVFDLSNGTLTLKPPREERPAMAPPPAAMLPQGGAA